MLKAILIGCMSVLAVLASSGYEVPEDNLLKRSGVSSSAKILFITKCEFSLVDEAETKPITNTSGIPTTLGQEGLEEFLRYGYLEVRETNDGYNLIGHIRMRGGMPAKGDSRPLLAGLFFSELGTEIEKLFARRRLLEER